MGSEIFAKVCVEKSKMGDKSFFLLHFAGLSVCGKVKNGGQDFFLLHFAGKSVCGKVKNGGVP